MTLQSLEDFDRETTKKRERLIRDHALVASLPTAGVAVNWVGDAGYDKEGKPLPPTERTTTLQPWILHSSTLYGVNDWASFKVPDNSDGGESKYGQHRKELTRQYLKALLDACEPYMIDVLAIEGTYKSYVPETFNYKEARDYKDAKEVARGRFEVRIGTGSGYTSQNLQFYIVTRECTPVRIQFDLDSFNTSKLFPGASRDYDGHATQWHHKQHSDAKAVQLYKRAGATRNSHGMTDSYDYDWLFASREDLEKALQLDRE